MLWPFLANQEGVFCTRSIYSSVVASGVFCKTSHTKRCSNNIPICPIQGPTGPFHCLPMLCVTCIACTSVQANSPTWLRRASRVLFTRVLFTITPKWRACSQAKIVEEFHTFSVIKFFFFRWHLAKATPSLTLRLCQELPYSSSIKYNLFVVTRFPSLIVVIK